MISRETIQEIKSKAKIFDVVAETVALKRQGSGYTGLCPFHAEKSPSFHVREEDNYYHCFGCGVSGNVFSFLMETRGISFPEAVEELAGRLGVEIKYEGRAKKDEPNVDKNLLFSLNQMAAKYFRANLASASAIVKDYVKSRGLTADAVKRFAVGFAPDGRDSLTQLLLREKIPEDILLQTGLVRRGSSGELYDTFRARLIFPVAIDSKKIAGFGGRIIPPLLTEEQRQNLPKYLNSPETPIYQKKKILYGLPAALETIRSSKAVYLVEGYMDVIGLWQAGVKNAIATCGTAVSEQHIQRLAQLARKVRVLFDGDDAGREAAAKTFLLFLDSGVDALALFLPKEEDPDSLAKRLGQDTEGYLEELVPVPLIDCFIDSLLKRQAVSDVKSLGAAGKGKVAQSVVEAISRVSNQVEKSELIKRAAFRLILNPEELLALSAQAQPKNQSGAASTERNSVVLRQGPAGTFGELSAEIQAGSSAPGKKIEDLPLIDRELLLALMAKRDVLPAKVLHDSEVCIGVDPLTIAFAEGLLAVVSRDDLNDAGKREQIGLLLKGFGESWVSHWRKAYKMLDAFGVDFELTYEECRRAIRKNQLNQEIVHIQREIQRSSDESRKIELHGAMVRVKRQLESTLREAGNR